MLTSKTMSYNPSSSQVNYYMYLLIVTESWLTWVSGMFVYLYLLFYRKKRPETQNGDIEPSVSFCPVSSTAIESRPFGSKCHRGSWKPHISYQACPWCYTTSPTLLRHAHYALCASVVKAKVGREYFFLTSTNSDTQVLPSPKSFPS